MFDTVGDDQEFAFVQLDIPVAELHSQRSGDHEKEFILHIVLVPDELPFELGQFDMLTIQFTHDPRVPMVVEEGEFFTDIDLIHSTEVEKGILTG